MPGSLNAELGGRVTAQVSLGSQLSSPARNLLVAGDAQFANVRDYGAVGDGVHDDAAAIQLAIDTVTQAGGVVYFPAGRYRCASTLVVRRSPGNITLRGDGFDSRLYLREDGTGLDVGDGAVLMQYFTLRDLTLTRVNVGTGDQLRMRLVAQWRILDCQFSGGDNCVNLDAASIGEIRGCIFGDRASNAFVLFQNCAVVDVVDCYFENNGATVAHLQFGAALNLDVCVLGCRFTNGVSGIVASGGPGLRGATISGCVFRGTLVNAIRIDGIAGQESERVTIVGNSLLASAAGVGIGILIAALANHCVVVGNVVRQYATNISDLGTADVVANNVSY